jgi:hypothetical protein
MFRVPREDLSVPFEVVLFAGRELTLVQGVRSCYLGYRLLRVIVTCGATRRFLVGFCGQSLLLCPNARSEIDKFLPSTLDFTRRL